MRTLLCCLALTLLTGLATQASAQFFQLPSYPPPPELHLDGFDHVELYDSATGEVQLVWDRLDVHLGNTYYVYGNVYHFYVADPGGCVDFDSIYAVLHTASGDLDWVEPIGVCPDGGSLEWHDVALWDSDGGHRHHLESEGTMLPDRGYPHALLSWGFYDPDDGRLHFYRLSAIIDPC